MVVNTNTNTNADSNLSNLERKDSDTDPEFSEAVEHYHYSNDTENPSSVTRSRQPSSASSSVNNYPSSLHSVRSRLPVEDNYVKLSVDEHHQHHGPIHSHIHLPIHLHKNEENNNTTDANSVITTTLTRQPSHIPGMLDPSPPWDQINIFHEIVFVILLCVAQLFTQASVAQTIVPIQSIAESFNVTSPGEMSWFSASFSLTVGTFILIAGRLGDMYGLKLMYLLGFAWYGLWSLLCGISIYSKSHIFFSICRAFQGIGPAFMMPNAVGIIGSYYPLGLRRVVVMCCFGGVAPAGFMVGSVFSALFTQLAGSWPWAFYAMAIACTVVTVLGIFIIPKNIGTDFDKSQAGRQKFDFLGAITGVAGLFLFNFAWNQGAVVGWETVYVYVLLIVGVLILIAFFLIERRVENPLLPGELLKGESGAILGCMAAGWSCFGIWVYYTHQFGFLIEDRTPLNMSARLSPIPLGGIAAALTTVFLLGNGVHSSIIMFVAMCGFFIGSTLMGTRPINQVYWGQFFVSLIVIPFGMDMSFPAGTVILSNMLPQHKQGVAGSVINTVVNYSISIGLGIAGTIEHYQLKRGFSELETIRHSFYMGMGLAGLGLVISGSFIIKQFLFSKDDLNEDGNESSSSSIKQKEKERLAEEKSKRENNASPIPV